MKVSISKGFGTEVAVFIYDDEGKVTKRYFVDFPCAWETVGNMIKNEDWKNLNIDTQIQ